MVVLELEENRHSMALFRTLPVTSVRTASESASSNPTKKRRFYRKLRIALLVVLALCCSLFVPPVYRFAWRQLLNFAAWKADSQLQIASLKGSVFEPLVCEGISWQRTVPSAIQLKVKIARAEAEFSWKEVFSKNPGRWFRRFSIDGAVCSVDFATLKEMQARTSRPSEPPQATKPHPALWLAPELFEVRRMDIILGGPAGSVRFEGSNCTFSQLEEGNLDIEKISVRHPWLARTFSKVHGVTAIKGSTVLIANLKLDSTVAVNTFSADLGGLPESEIDIKTKLEVFDGVMDGEIHNLNQNFHSGLDATLNFSTIAIAKFATFFGLSDAAGGTIKDGRLTFRGSPHKFARASGSLQFEADNFQWESRQWDSLIIRSTLLERRISLPQCDLVQGHNQLNLSGDFTLPQPGREWWDSEFTANIAARIENLTELSALMLPEFKYTAGRMSIDGSVRGKSKDFHGAIICSGSSITWHNAPIEDLRAALRFNGNELNISNLELLNKDDFFRGSGVVNILGERQYWGDFRASIADLAAYSSLMEDAFFPGKVAGGAALQWKGEGGAKGHSGQFTGQFTKLKSLGVTGKAPQPTPHPVNAEVQGTYAKGVAELSRLVISDAAASFSTAATIKTDGFSLHSIRLLQGDTVSMEGEMTVPMDLWKAWKTRSWNNLFVDHAPLNAHLTATRLSFADATALTGWNWPVKGTVTGKIQYEGRLGALASSSQISLAEGSLALRNSDKKLAAIYAEVRTEGNILYIDHFGSSDEDGSNFGMSGNVDFSSTNDPALNISFWSGKFDINLFPDLPYLVESPVPTESTSIPSTSETGFDAAIAGSFHAEGTYRRAALTGSALLLSIRMAGLPDISPLLNKKYANVLPSLFGRLPAFADGWNLQLSCDTSEPAPIDGGDGSVRVAVTVGGTGASPSLGGTAEVWNMPVTSVGSSFVIDHATAIFDGTRANDPTIDLSARSNTAEWSVIANVVGPLSQRLIFFDCAPPLRATRFRQLLEGRNLDGLQTPLVDWLTHGRKELYPSLLLEETNAPATP